MASVGATTTMLVVSDDQPLGRFVTAHADHRRAQDLRQSGATLVIITEGDLRRRVNLPLA